ncbi:MAG TPA: 50S ribosomal protein L24 [Dehalococcoidia bacterium]|nr:50S ribosomal protein L24 [Dehalococcoidia bacterium]
MRKIKQNDNVMVMTGKDRGRTGAVRVVLPDEGRVIVTGVNMVKRHMRQRSLQQPGGIIEKEAPVAISNVRIVCPACGKATRVGFRIRDDGGKGRYCKSCDGDID